MRIIWIKPLMCESLYHRWAEDQDKLLRGNTCVYELLSLSISKLVKSVQLAGYSSIIERRVRAPDEGVV